MRLSGEMLNTLKKLAFGYTDYVVREEYLPLCMLKGEERERALQAESEEGVVLQKKRGRPKKNLVKEQTYVTFDRSKITDWGEGETRLVCVKREIVPKVHDPEISAIKMLVELDRLNEASDFEKLADEIVMLSKDELIELRKDLLMRDLEKDFKD